MRERESRLRVICIDNDEYPASLEIGKIYVALRDAGVEKIGYLRVIDESGEAYLYPKALFRNADGVDA